MKTEQKEVISWWYDRRDYTTGVMLLSRICKNKTIATTLSKPGKEKFPANVHKLHYELAKSAGLDWLHMPKLPHEPDSVSPSKIIPEPNTKNLSQDLIPPSDELNLDSQLDQYPKTIRRIIYESSNTYNKRSILHTQMRSIDPANTNHNVTLRSNLLKEIKAYSEILDRYNEFLEDFHKNNIVPSEQDVWPTSEPNNENPKPKTSDELKKQKKNLQSENTKDGFRLRFQQRTQGQTENPMPEGPKRTAIENRIVLRKKQIEEIDTILNTIENAVQTD